MSVEFFSELKKKRNPYTLVKVASLLAFANRSLVMVEEGRASWALRIRAEIGSASSIGLLNALSFLPRDLHCTEVSIPPVRTIVIKYVQITRIGGSTIVA